MLKLYQSPFLEKLCAFGTKNSKERGLLVSLRDPGNKETMEKKICAWKITECHKKEGFG